MTIALDQSCLHSTVRNTSGIAKKFGFLPPHGVELAIDEELTVFGNIIEAISVGPDRVSSRRNHQALAAAIDRGDIEILQTPSPIFLTPNGTVKMLAVSNAGLVSGVDPCWADSLSASLSGGLGEAIVEDPNAVPA